MIGEEVEFGPKIKKHSFQDLNSPPQNMDFFKKLKRKGRWYSRTYKRTILLFGILSTMLATQTPTKVSLAVFDEIPLTI